jgi:hypothetical protein
MLRDLTWAQILGLSVIAAVITVIGNLVATWLKEYLFARSMERWRRKQELLSIYARYRDPLLLAARELKARVEDICDTYPTNYLQTSVLTATRVDQLLANSIDDEYYRQYRLTSTIYRLCSFLGWLELYRQELTFLDSGRRNITERLESVIEHIRGDLADGNLNRADDFYRWADRLVFREEQRAVGEGMITAATSPRTVIGYGVFRNLLQRATTNTDEDELWWIRIVSGFLLDLQAEKDFRRHRLDRLRGHLDEASNLLLPRPHWWRTSGRAAS